MLNFMFTLLLTLNYVGEDCTKFDLIVICDYSASLRNNERVISSAVEGFSSFLKIGEEDTKFGIVVFSDYSEVFCPLTTDEELIKSRITTLHTLSVMSTTNLSSALLTTYDEFKKSSRPDTKQIIVLISDSMPDNQTQALDIANTLKMLNIDIFTLLINGEIIDEGYMKQIASPNSYFSTNYEQLTKTLQNINFCL